MSNEQKKFQVWWDKKEKVVRTKVIGFQTDIESAKNFAEEIVKLAENLKSEGIKYIDSLNDVAAAGISINPAVRKIYVDVLKKDDFSKSRAAMFGMRSPYYRTILNILLTLSGVGSVKFFKNEEKALEWIKEERRKRDAKIKN